MKTYTKSNGIINYKVLNVHNTSHACQWRIFAPAGQLIKLNFVQINFMLPCESSYLVIRNGKHSSSPLLEKFCKDKKPPKSMTLLSQSLFIQYYMDRADDSEENQGVGMKLSYRGEQIHTPFYIYLTIHLVARTFQIKFLRSNNHRYAPYSFLYGQPQYETRNHILADMSYFH